MSAVNNDTSTQPLGVTPETPIAATHIKLSKRAKVKAFVINTVKKIVTLIKCLVITVISVGLYCANPSLFALGFVVGLVADEKVRETVAKAQRICAAKPWVIIIVGIGSFLALPITVATSSFVCGAYVSSKIAGMVPSDYQPRHCIPDLLRNNTPKFIWKRLPKKVQTKLAGSEKKPRVDVAG